MERKQIHPHNRVGYEYFLGTSNTKQRRFPLSINLFLKGWFCLARSMMKNAMGKGALKKNKLALFSWIYSSLLKTGFVAPKNQDIRQDGKDFSRKWMPTSRECNFLVISPPLIFQIRSWSNSSGNTQVSDWWLLLQISKPNSPPKSHFPSLCLKSTQPQRVTRKTTHHNRECCDSFVCFYKLHQLHTRRIMWFKKLCLSVWGIRMNRKTNSPSLQPRKLL